MGRKDLVLFALNATRPFAEQVADELGARLGDHEERGFEDGEHKTRPLAGVRDADVYVIQSLYGGPEETVNDKLCRFLFFIGALKDAGAARVTAVAPYLCYARKDQRSKPRDPVTTRYVARLFEAAGADRIVTLDVHNLAAYQNAFRIPAEHLEATWLLARPCAALIGNRQAVVVSPDAGGVKRADRFRGALSGILEREVGGAFLEKYRSEGVVTGSAVVGEVEGKVAVIVDDLISTGTTLLRGATACRGCGATEVFAAASHGLFVGDAGRVVAEPALSRTLVTDAVPPFRLDRDELGDRLVVVSVAQLFAETIRRLHTGGSLVELTAGA